MSGKGGRKRAASKLAESGEMLAASEEFLAGYNASEYPPFAVTADIVILTVREEKLCVLLIERGDEPYRGCWALPGGFCDEAEDIEQAAERELREETGLDSFNGHLEQLGSWGKAGRDPRMRVVSVAWLAFAPDVDDPVAGSDAAAARWWPVEELDLEGAGGVGLAFDHAEILRAGIERARSKLEYTPLAAAFCAETFTIGELRGVYEAVWGDRLDPRNFHRKVTTTAGFVDRVEGELVASGGRPAAGFRRGRAVLLHPPLLRPGRELVAAEEREA